MESNDFSWEQRFNLEECFSDDLKKHQFFESPSPVSFSDDLKGHQLFESATNLSPSPACFSDDLNDHQLFESTAKISPPSSPSFSFDDPVFQEQDPLYVDACLLEPKQEDFKKNISVQLQQIIQQTSDEEPVQQEPIEEVPSQYELPYSPPFSPGVLSSGLILFDQDSVTCAEETVVTQKLAPRIISVPVSDAVGHRQLPLIKISNIQYEEPQVQPPLKLRVVKPASRNVLHPIMIKLKRVTRPIKKVASKMTFKPVPKHVELTLKDILSTEKADDLIRELVSPASVTLIDDTNDIVLSDAESEFDESSSSSFVFSPMSHGSSELHMRPESPGSPYVDEISEEHLSHASKRPGPYSVTERKLRKKEQNKRAALRYRQKKKDEGDTIYVSLEKEEQRHKELQAKFDSLNTEVNLMKKLMREVIAAKTHK